MPKTKRGPKPKPPGETLSRRISMRLTEETYAPFAELAEVLNVTPSLLMRQALEAAGPTMMALAAAFREMYGDQPVRGVELYQQMLRAMRAELGVHEQLGEVWHDQAEEAVKQRGVQE